MEVVTETILVVLVQNLHPAEMEEQEVQVP